MPPVSIPLFPHYNDMFSGLRTQGGAPSDALVDGIVCLPRSHVPPCITPPLWYVGSGYARIRAFPVNPLGGVEGGRKKGRGGEWREGGGNKGKKGVMIVWRFCSVEVWCWRLCWDAGAGFRSTGDRLKYKRDLCVLLILHAPFAWAMCSTQGLHPSGCG